MLDRQTKMAVAVTVVAILFILILAFYGYFSGAWEAAGDKMKP